MFIYRNVGPIYVIFFSSFGPFFPLNFKVLVSCIYKIVAEEVFRDLCCKGKRGDPKMLPLTFYMLFFNLRQYGASPYSIFLVFNKSFTVS